MTLHPSITPTTALAIAAITRIDVAQCRLFATARPARPLTSSDTTHIPPIVPMPNAIRYTICARMAEGEGPTRMTNLLGMPVGEVGGMGMRVRHPHALPVPTRFRDQRGDTEEDEHGCHRQFERGGKRGRNTNPEHADDDRDRRHTDRVSGPPRQTERRCRAQAALAGGQYADGGEMIRFEGVPEPDQETDADKGDMADVHG